MNIKSKNGNGEESPYPWRIGEPPPRYLIDGFEATNEVHRRMMLVLPEPARRNAADALINNPVFGDRLFHPADIHETQRRHGLISVESAGRL